MGVSGVERPDAALAGALQHGEVGRVVDAAERVGRGVGDGDLGDELGGHAPSQPVHGGVEALGALRVAAGGLVAVVVEQRRDGEHDATLRGCGPQFRRRRSPGGW